jgi:uncharacterized protein YjbI with pentapeptide repeats
MNGKEFLRRYLIGEKNFEGMQIDDLSIEYEPEILEGLDLSNATLSNCNLKNVRFQNSNFNKACFYKSYFEESSFINISFEEVNFSEIDAVLLNFDFCNFKRSRFNECGFGDVFFKASDLTESRWQNTSWVGGITNCNINNASINNLDMRSVVVTNTFFPDGTLVNQVIKSLIVDSASSLSSFIKMFAQTAIEPITKVLSSTGNDFSKLNTLLASRKWVEADEETALLMCKLVGLEAFDMIEVEWIMKIACSDLNLIDKLWRDYSNNKFGFSIQSKIWEESRKKFNDVDDLRRAFCGDMMKWDNCDSNVQIIFEPRDNSSNLQILGYLPAIGIWTALHGVFFFGDEDFECVYNRLLECNSTAPTVTPMT